MNINNSILEKTHMTQYDLNNLVTMNPFDPQKIEAEASTLIYYNQKPLLEELPKLQSESSVRRKGTTVVFLGDGEFITDGSIITSVEDLKKKGRVVENLVLAETEISAELLHNLLVTLKPDLKALYIFRVPLDYEHIEKLNELDLGLEFLSLGYVETDQSNPFKKEQQKEKAYKPFDINKLNFKGLGPCLKFLQLQGITLKTDTIDVLAKTYSDSIEILLLEGLKSSEQSKQELVQHILGVLSTFNNLKGLSLAKNSLASIKFNEADSEEEQEENRESQSNQSIKFPSTLMALNLNACNLDNKQVHDLVGKLEEAKCPLKALHLEGSRLYSRTLEAVSKFGQSCNNNGGFLLEMSKPPIDPSGRNVFKDPKSKIQNIQTKITEVFSELLENSTILETLKTSEARPEWISQLSKKQDFIQLLPYLLKLLRQIKFFDDAYQYNKVDLRTNAKVLIPKHDFNELLNKIANDSNGTLDLGDTIVGQFDHNLIRHVHPTLLRDDDWAKLPLKNQRDNFLELMKKLGYNHIEKKHKDCFEDQFVMAVKISRRVSYDYTLATFSLFWYYNQVSVKFNLSDDWYLNRKQRFNRYAPPNQDFLISFCGEWNTHANDFVFELDIKDDGEPEIKFKSSIWKDGDLNVARALLIAIDRGFVMLKALYKMELFDKGDVFQGVEDSKKVRKILKEKLRKYAKSQDFENLRKQEIAILGEPELEEEAVEEEQQ